MRQNLRGEMMVSKTQVRTSSLLPAPCLASRVLGVRRRLGTAQRDPVFLVTVSQDGFSLHNPTFVEALADVILSSSSHVCPAPLQTIFPSKKFSRLPRHSLGPACNCSLFPVQLMIYSIPMYSNCRASCWDCGLWWLAAQPAPAMWPCCSACTMRAAT